SWLDDIVAVQAVILGIAELLEGFGQGAWNRPDQLIAVEVLAAEQYIKAQPLAQVIVAFDRVDPLILARRPGAVDSGERVVEHGIRIVGQRQILLNRSGDRVDAVWTNHVQ